VPGNREGEIRCPECDSQMEMIREPRPPRGPLAQARAKFGREIVRRREPAAAEEVAKARAILAAVEERERRIRKRSR